METTTSPDSHLTHPYWIAYRITPVDVLRVARFRTLQACNRKAEHVGVLVAHGYGEIPA